jgi:hypothetical protein
MDYDSQNLNYLKADINQEVSDLLLQSQDNKSIPLYSKNNSEISKSIDLENQKRS